MKLTGIFLFTLVLLTLTACTSFFTTSTVLQSSTIIQQVNPPSQSIKPAQPEIDEVTLDTLMYKYVINFSANPPTTTHHYNIYKEIAVDVYEKIGEVPAISNSSNYSYMDNMSNPGQYPARYRISAVDNNALESLLSNYHQPVFLQISHGVPDSNINLVWTPYYGRTPVKYEIYRGSTPENTYTNLIDTISGSLTAYTDISVYDIYYYFVKPLFSTDFEN